MDELITLNKKRLLRNFIACGVTSAVIGWGFGSGLIQRVINETIRTIETTWNYNQETKYKGDYLYGQEKLNEIYLKK